MYVAENWRHQLWGTGARAPPPELGHVEKFGSFYVHNIRVRSSPRLQCY